MLLPIQQVQEYFSAKTLESSSNFVNSNLKVNLNLLKQLKQGFNQTINWYKHQLKGSTLTENQNLDYLTDPRF